MDAGAIAYEVLDGLRACLCTAVEESEGGGVCFCGLYPGSEAVADYCNCKPNMRGEGGCGMAWARLASIYPYGPTFPGQAQNPTCDSPMAAVIELGVFRCLPGLNGQGKAPDPVAQARAVQVQASDAGAMLRAFACCDALTDRDYVLGRYTPQSSGGCGGGVWQATVALRRV